MTLKYFYNKNAGTNDSIFVDLNNITNNYGLDPSTTSNSQYADLGYYYISSKTGREETVTRDKVSRELANVKVDYVIEGSECTEVWSLIYRDFNEIISYYKSQVKDHAYDLLKSSDWMAYRKADAGIEIPDEWFYFRKSVREESSTKESSINSIETIEELETYIRSDSYLNWPTKPIN